MITRAHTVTFEGMEPREVDVECAISPGLPGFAIVGLPDKAVSEARERIRAVLNGLSLALPAKKITINLTPADLPKTGSHFDLAIALALLAALEVVPRDAVGEAIAIGEVIDSLTVTFATLVLISLVTIVLHDMRKMVQISTISPT